MINSQTGKMPTEPGVPTLAAQRPIARAADVDRADPGTDSTSDFRQITEAARGLEAPFAFGTDNTCRTLQDDSNGNYILDSHGI